MIMPEPPPVIDRPTKKLILHIVRTLWDSVLIGGAPDVIEKRYQRMHKPQWGDLVAETSTWWMLLTRDPDFQDERWDGQLVRYWYTEQLEFGERHVCLNPDGTTFNWTNATLIAVPPFITKE